MCVCVCLENTFMQLCASTYFTTGFMEKRALTVTFANFCGVNTPTNSRFQATYVTPM